VAKKLHKRILQLGGVQLFRRGLGDDQHQLGYAYADTRKACASMAMLFTSYHASSDAGSMAS
jgi:hypothetical protein